jgi:hypothetical protein
MMHLEYPTLCVLWESFHFIVLNLTTDLNSFFYYARYHCSLQTTRFYVLQLLITTFQNSVTQYLKVDHDSDGGDEDVTVWQPYVSLALSSGCPVGNAQ